MIVRRALLLVVLSFLRMSDAFAMPTHYEYPEGGILFNHSGLAMKDRTREGENLSVWFSVGESPFSVNIAFKERDTPLQDFIDIERENFKKGGYENEVELIEHSLPAGKAYEIIRTSPTIKIRWYLFESLKNKKVYSFWLAEESRLKEENTQAINAYEKMKASLVISE